MVATMAHLYGRRLFLNWVAGGFRNDLLALSDETPHDRRYDRLVEYATIVRRLTEGESVTFSGEFYQVNRLTLSPIPAAERRPEFMVSGSSEAGRHAARVLGARSVAYALPSDDHLELPSRPGLASGLRVGIIARDSRDAAWRVAHTRFPPDRKGKLTRELARKVSDSRWHERLCRLADERAASDDPYWLVPFENYKTMCPYLVGTREEVAREIARYLSIGFGTFILDIPSCEEDVAEAAAVFEMALSSGVRHAAEATAST
jgi:alkanesulfonate monooxygenase